MSDQPILNGLLRVVGVSILVITVLVVGFITVMLGLMVTHHDGTRVTTGTVVQVAPGRCHGRPCWRGAVRWTDEQGVEQTVMPPDPPTVDERDDPSGRTLLGRVVPLRYHPESGLVAGITVPEVGLWILIIAGLSAIGYWRFRWIWDQISD